METLARKFSLTRHDEYREVHYVLRGLWTVETSTEVQRAFLDACKPFVEKQQNWRVLGDLTDFPVQTREVAEQIRLIQEAAPSLGVDRMALIVSSVLLKQQLMRVSEAVNMEFFETKAAALGWLRSK